MTLDGWPDAYLVRISQYADHPVGTVDCTMALDVLRRPPKQAV